LRSRSARSATCGVGQIGDLRGVPALLSLLEDPEEQVRFAAAEALGQIGDVRALEPLCKLLARNVRESAVAARALGRLRDQRAIEPLAQFLLAPESRADCSDEAAEALAQFRHGESVAALVKAGLGARDDEVKRNARRALAKLTGNSFGFEPDETLAKWWEQNREHYTRAITEKK
jgi:HEAT repeat protein